MKRALIAVLLLAVQIFANESKNHDNLIKFAIEEGCLSPKAAQVMTNVGIENIIVETRRVLDIVYEDTFRAKDPSKEDWIIKVYHNNNIAYKKDKKGEMIYDRSKQEYIKIKGEFKIYSCVGKVIE